MMTAARHFTHRSGSCSVIAWAPPTPSGRTAWAPARPSDGPDRVLETFVEASKEPGDEPVGSLEPITSVTAGLQNPRAAVQALLTAMPRTAMIEVAGRPRGKLEDWNVPSEHLNFARLELAPVPEGPDGVGRGAYQLDATTYTTSRPARCCSSCGWGGLSAS
jgi:hypothetical protein